MTDSSTIRRMIRHMNAASDDRTVTGNDGAESGGEPTRHTESDLDLSFLDAAPGTNLLGRLGKFEILSVLGFGAMGYVLKALDPLLDRMVALKVLSPLLSSNAKARQRFTREGRAAASINHPNVVSIYSVDDSLKLPYLVMEFIDGVSLHEHIKRHPPLTAWEIENIAVPMAAGLSAAHSKRIIHRDIKPANIMLGNNGLEVKITDFGLAKPDAGLSDITMLGSLIGTPAFMSPEQVTGRPVDARSDLFSFGCVMYTMVTGNSPFQGHEVAETLHKIATLEPTPLHEVNRSIPLSLSNIVSRLLQKDPEQRFSSASELETELQMSSGSSEQTVELPPTGKPPASNRLRRASMLVACLAIVAALITWLWWPNQAKIERDVAISVLEAGGKVTVLVGDRSFLVSKLDGLPPEDFVIDIVDYEENLNLTDELLKPLADLRSLRELRLSSSNIAEVGLSHVVVLTKLDYLGLAHTGISDSELESVVNMQNLTRLNLNDTEISAEGLKHVLRLKNLKKLYLSGTKVKRNWFELLAKSQLVVLDLKNTNVTNTDIMHLKGLSSLKKLFLQSTKVTLNGVKKLKKQLPGCKITR